MAKNLIIVDSCVLIKAFRKDVIAINDLKEIIDITAYSVITQLELLIGANTLQKKEAVNTIFESYYGIPLNPTISAKAIQIMNTYVTGQRIISVPDCLIAATSITTGYPLFTYNKKDFDFIEGLNLFESIH
ncbi:MAG: PIN domain-containing protein [Bacteroidota bacterium]|nr:PIN domain-containing protein [Bacteroidota bacterium]